MNADYVVHERFYMLNNAKEAKNTIRTVEIMLLCAHIYIVCVLF